MNPSMFSRKGATVAALLAAFAAVAAVEEVKVSDFGFSPDDSTKFLQKALSCGARRVVVDKQDGPWITRPLRIRRNNLELVFEPGVELLAKKGEFLGRTDALIDGSGTHGLTIVGNGATLRMHMADYLKKPYARAEWRHGLNFINARNLTVENLRIIDTGGDAIYLGGTTNNACVDVTIRGVTAIGNLRQGISVISAENLLVENCLFENTCGLPPMDGIDFEPNSPSHRLVNCVVRNCVSRGNRGNGWDVAIFNLNSSTPPVSILFDGCVEEDNRGSFRVWCENRDFDCVRGRVTVRNCSFARPKQNKFSYGQNPDFPVVIDFQNCRYVPTEGAEPTDVPDWKALNIAPVLSGAPLVVKAVKNFDLSNAVAHDSKPGELVPLSRFNLRYRCRYVFYADRARVVRFRGRQTRLGAGKAGPNDIPFTVEDAAGRKVATVAVPGFEEGDFSVAVPAAGFYFMYAPCQNSAFMLTASDAPVAINGALGRLAVINSTGRLYFDVADTSRPVAFTACGDRSERLHARLLAPDGSVEWDRDNIDRSYRHVVGTPAKGLWTIQISKASSGGFEDYKIDLAGIPSLFFLSPDKTWSILPPSR